VSEGGPHDFLLRLLGAKESPTVVQFLEWLGVASESETTMIWRHVVDAREKIDDNIARRFRSLPLYPIDSSNRIAPDALVISPSEFAGKSDGLFVVPEQKLDTRELNTLLRLGARKLESLDPAQLVRLLREIKADGGFLADSSAEFMMTVLGECERRQVESRELE